MKVFQLQTPQRDQSSANRLSKSTSHISKIPQKCQVPKKKPSPVFQAASEDESSVLQSLKEFPEVSEENSFVESSENFIASVDPVGTPSSQTVAISDLTSPTLSSLSVTTSDDHVSVNATDTKCNNSTEADFFDEIKSIETELVIKHLREARRQVLKSKDVDSSKKILDALIKISIEELNGGVREENEWLDKLLSGKANMVMLSLMLGMYVMFMLWFFNSDARGVDSNGLRPT